MILNCENCKTRYLVASSTLAPDGRRVRCTVCHHEWYQEYEEDEGLIDEEEDLEPIPDAVKPIPEGSSVPAMPENVVEKGEKISGLGGYVAAMAVFLLVFTAFLVSRDVVVKLWPESGGFYALLHMEPSLPGEGLIFDQMTAKAKAGEDGEYVLNLDGNILNLTGDEVALPAIQAALYDVEGTEVNLWSLDVEDKAVPASSEVDFTGKYENLPEDIKEVTVRFMLDGATEKVAPDVSDMEQSEEDSPSVERHENENTHDDGHH